MQALPHDELEHQLVLKDDNEKSTALITIEQLDSSPVENVCLDRSPHKLEHATSLSRATFSDSTSSAESSFASSLSSPISENREDKHSVS